MDTLIKRGLLLIIVLGFLQGCGRSGSSEVEEVEDPFQYKFVAEDGALIGLSVIDNSGTAATEVTPGVYQFAEDYEPVPPIKFVSQNRSELGSSFQDLDSDNERTAADIDYNVSLELAYIGEFQAAGDREVYANPITALIPASGIPSAGIGGLPEDLLVFAFRLGIENAPTTGVTITDGVELSVKQVLSRTAALITALQEGIYIIEGSNEAAGEISHAVLVGLRAAELSSGLLDTSNFSSVAQSAIEASVSQANRDKVMQLASSLGILLMTEFDVQFYESLILTVMRNVTADSSVEAIAGSLTAQAFKRNDLGVQYAIKLATDIAASGGMSAFLNGLSIVPIAIGNNGTSLVDDGVSDFNLELVEATANVKINATDAFFDQVELQYYFADDLYGATVDTNHAVLMALNANETNLLGAHDQGFNSVRLLALCWHEVEQNNDENSEVCGTDNSNLEFYGLATEAEVCNAAFDEVELAQINALNRQQITCN